MRTLSDYERGFIEGFLDADGSIVLSKGTGQVNPNIRINFSNNCVEILEKIQSILGTNYKILPKKRSKNHQFTICSTKSYELLKQIKLVVKEHRRLVGIKIFEVVRPRQHKNQWSDLSDSQKRIDNLIAEFYQ